MDQHQKLLNLLLGHTRVRPKRFLRSGSAFLGYEEKTHTDTITHEPSSPTAARDESSSQYWMTGLKGKMHF